MLRRLDFLPFSQGRHFLWLLVLLSCISNSSVKGLLFSPKGATSFLVELIFFRKEAKQICLRWKCIHSPELLSKLSVLLPFFWHFLDAKNKNWEINTKWIFHSLQFGRLSQMIFSLILFNSILFSPLLWEALAWKVNQFQEVEDFKEILSAFVSLLSV